MYFGVIHRTYLQLINSIGGFAEFNKAAKSINNFNPIESLTPQQQSQSLIS
jgi:hypothetical protein